MKENVSDIARYKMDSRNGIYDRHHKKKNEIILKSSRKNKLVTSIYDNVKLFKQNINLKMVIWCILNFVNSILCKVNRNYRLTTTHKN
jgi:hypothetical protein